MAIRNPESNEPRFEMFVQYTPALRSKWSPAHASGWDVFIDSWVLTLQREPANTNQRVPEDQWRELQSLGIKSLIFYPSVPDDALLEGLLEGGYTVYLASHAVPLHFRARYGLEEGDDRTLDFLRDWNRRYPGRLWWGACGETAVEHPTNLRAIGYPPPGSGRFLSKSDAYMKVMVHFRNEGVKCVGYQLFFYGQKRWSDPPNPTALRNMMNEAWFAGGFPRIEGFKLFGFAEVEARARRTGTDIRDYQMVLGDGHNSHMVHYMPEWGASRLQAEFNAGCPPAQPVVPFLRGAARGAGIPYGIHWSSWGGQDFGSQTFDEKGRVPHGVFALPSAQAVGLCVAFRLLLHHGHGELFDAGLVFRWAWEAEDDCLVEESQGPRRAGAPHGPARPAGRQARGAVRAIRVDG